MFSCVCRKPSAADADITDKDDDDELSTEAEKLLPLTTDDNTASHAVDNVDNREAKPDNDGPTGDNVAAPADDVDQVDKDANGGEVFVKFSVVPEEGGSIELSGAEQSVDAQTVVDTRLQQQAYPAASASYSQLFLFCFFVTFVIIIN